MLKPRNELGGRCIPLVNTTLVSLRCNEKEVLCFPLFKYNKYEQKPTTGKGCSLSSRPSPRICEWTPVRSNFWTTCSLIIWSTSIIFSCDVKKNSNFKKYQIWQTRTHKKHVLPPKIWKPGPFINDRTEFRILSTKFCRFFCWLNFNCNLKNHN